MIKITNKAKKLILLFFMLVFLFAFQKNNYLTVQNTIKVFFSSVVPSLFPFILCTNIIINGNLIDTLTEKFNKYKYLLSATIIGFLCGYPMGAKISYKYYSEDSITKDELKFLMSFINNCNPIFILSTIGLCVFNDISIGLVLCISHYISSIIIAISFYIHNNIIHKNIKKSNKISKNESKKLHKSFFEILDMSIKSSFIVIGNIFAFILIFNLLFSIIEKLLLSLNVSPNTIYTLSGIFEVTNGSRMLYLNATLPFNMLTSIISFLLGFSGFSIIFQIYSCIYTAGIRISHIIKYKFIQGVLSFITTYILLKIIPNFSISSKSILNLNSTSYFIIIVAIIFLITYTIKKVTQK